MSSRYLFQTFELPKTTIDPQWPYLEAFDPPEGYRLFRVLTATDRPSRLEPAQRSPVYYPDERLTGVLVVVWERES